MKFLGAVFRSEKRFRAAQQFARVAEKPLVNREGWIGWLPGILGGWTQSRDLHSMPRQSFREWFEAREKKDGAHD